MGLGLSVLTRGGIFGRALGFRGHGFIWGYREARSKGFTNTTTSHESRATHSPGRHGGSLSDWTGVDDLFLTNHKVSNGKRKCEASETRRDGDTRAA